MFKYDPNNLNLLDDLRKENTIKQKQNDILEKKISLKKEFPSINIENLEILKLSNCPKNGVFTYMEDNSTNKIYGFSFNKWIDITNDYDWNTIISHGSFW